MYSCECAGKASNSSQNKYLHLFSYRSSFSSYKKRYLFDWKILNMSECLCAALEADNNIVFIASEKIGTIKN